MSADDELITHQRTFTVPMHPGCNKEAGVPVDDRQLAEGDRAAILDRIGGELKDLERKTNKTPPPAGEVEFIVDRDPMGCLTGYAEEPTPPGATDIVKTTRDRMGNLTGDED